ncbi:MAG: ABC transporter ATP-binding protein [Planctomycetes bacterium]|nr:ABC transporter ATP-binding protein [Planctomycetota bacterium]
MIEFINVTKQLGKTMVLDGMNLKVNRGEILVIIGRSGTGKSVTLKLMIGLLKPDSGKLIIDNVDTTNMTGTGLSKIREKFGLLFQSGALLNSMTVAENVALPLKEHEKSMSVEDIDKKVRERLALVEMTEAYEKYPVELSGGMKKRAGLARAISRNPEIILYDEPTSGLDPVMANTINDLIVNTNKRLKATSVVVTHDMESAFRIADRIAMLYHGRIIQIGPPPEFKNPTNPIVRQFVFGETAGPMNQFSDDGTRKIKKTERMKP